VTWTLLELAPREIMVCQSFNGHFAISKEAERAKSHRRYREAILQKTGRQEDRVRYHRAWRRAAMLIIMSRNQTWPTRLTRLIEMLVASGVS